MERPSVPMMGNSAEYEEEGMKGIWIVPNSKMFVDVFSIGLGIDESDVDLLFDDMDDVENSILSCSRDEEGCSKECIVSCGESSADSASCQRKWCKRRRDHIPRVFRNDIRRHYSTMILNVFNRNCQDLVKSFFHCYGVPSFRVILRPLDPARFAHLPTDLVQSTVAPMIDGVSLEGEEWWNFHGLIHHVLSSDNVLRLNDARLITRARDRRSIVIMSTEMEMTQIFDIDPLEVMTSTFSFDPKRSEVEDPSKKPRKPRKPRNAESQFLLSPSTRETFDFRPKFQGAMKDSSPYVRVHSAPCTSLSSKSKATNLTTIRKTFGPCFVKLLAKPREYRMKSQIVLMIDENRCIESMTMGDGNLPVDLMDALEKRAIKQKI